MYSPTSPSINTTRFKLLFTSFSSYTSLQATLSLSLSTQCVAALVCAIILFEGLMIVYAGHRVQSAVAFGPIALYVVAICFVWSSYEWMPQARRQRQPEPNPEAPAQALLHACPYMGLFQLLLCVGGILVTLIDMLRIFHHHKPVHAAGFTICPTTLAIVFGITILTDWVGERILFWFAILVSNDALLDLGGL